LLGVHDIQSSSPTKAIAPAAAAVIADFNTYPFAEHNKHPKIPRHALCAVFT
jgi:hypothetical protein